MASGVKKPSKAKSVLITGGLGFIGSHLCQYYLSRQFTVIAVDNECTAHPHNKKFLQALPGASKHLHVVKADVTKPWTWAKKIPKKTLASLQTVFHLASPASPPIYQQMGLETLWVNSIGLKHALEFADQQRARVIFASTSEIYGNPTISPQPESYWGNCNTVGDRSCYDEAKRFGEALLWTHNKKYKTHHGIVRIFNTYGPRMNPADGRVVINFLTQATSGRALSIYGDGSHTRSFCYVDDLIRALVAFAEKKTFVGPVNLGNPKEITILELAQTVQKLIPTNKSKISFLPLPSDDPQHRKPNIDLAKKELNWSPEVSLNDGLEKMLEWLRRA